MIWRLRYSDGVRVCPPESETSRDRCLRRWLGVWAAGDGGGIPGCSSSTTDRTKMRAESSGGDWRSR